MVKYSIHRALAELKLLDKRITKTIDNLKVVTYKKGNKLEYNITEEEFKAVVEADMQSVKDLITRRKEIKEKIVKSKANCSLFLYCSEKVNTNSLSASGLDVRFPNCLSSEYSTCSFLLLIIAFKLFN